ncbi:MAG: hypothetical protein OEX21_09155, partial [Betaproteobacteria bacterium]|nr:hypothetical protein [Betaproteobacteria bacterium]
MRPCNNPRRQGMSQGQLIPAVAWAAVAPSVTVIVAVLETTPAEVASTMDTETVRPAGGVTTR